MLAIGSTFVARPTSATDLLVDSQVLLDAALSAVSDGDTVTIQGDGIQEGVATISAGILLRCDPPFASSLRHLEISGIPAPVVVEDLRFTGTWGSAWGGELDPELGPSVSIMESSVQFRSCLFEDLSWYLSPFYYKWPVLNVPPVYLQDSYGDFLQCEFLRLGGVYELAEGPAFGGVGQYGSGTARFRECRFEDTGLPIKSRDSVEIDACSFRNCGPGLIEARGDLVLTRSLVVLSGSTLYVFDELSNISDYANVITGEAGVRIEQNTFVDNPVYYRGWWGDSPVENPQVRHPLVHLGGAAHGSVSHNLFIGQGGGAVHAPESVQIACNDAYGSGSEDWTGGIGDVTGVDGNISEAPLFCGRDIGDYTLSLHSPAATASCGLMGAFPAVCDREIPIAIQDFSAAWAEDGVQLRWELAGVGQPEILLERLDARGLHEVYRGREPSFLDPAAPVGESLRYALGLIQDRTRLSGLAWSTVEGEPSPRRTRLLGAVPNPFNPRTEIRFELARRGLVSLEIHDASGRLVRGWSVPDLDAGPQSVTWDGTDRAGRQVASGVYFARLEFGGKAYRQRMVLLR